jgi:tRNA wybutosine-synthesizing protein 5
MDNFLIQISGKKRVILFSPSDVEYLYMKGDKSLVLDVDSPDLKQFPLFAKARRYECELLAGYCIFIPGINFLN